MFYYVGQEGLWILIIIEMMIVIINNYFIIIPDKHFAL